MQDSWQFHGLCYGQDPSLWLPDNKTTPDEAIATCNRCPVKDECHEYAETHVVYGIWGGKRYYMNVLRQSVKQREKRQT